MSYELIGIAVLWTFLFGYLIVASIDFGAGFFNYYSTVTGKNHLVGKVIYRYLSPFWEVTNVFLVFFFVGVIGFFPRTAYYYGTALLVPGSVAIIMLAIRGAYYAFNTYGLSQHRSYMFLYGATGVLFPAARSTVLTLSEGGYIEEIPAIAGGSRIRLDYAELLLSSYSWSVVLLAVVSVLYISAMFLTYYAASAKDAAATEQLRRYALAWSLPTIVSSLFVFISIREHSRWHFDHMVRWSPMFVLSFCCFAGAVVLVWRRIRYGAAFGLVMLQFAFAFYGYGAAHLPYLLYPYLNIKDSVTGDAMAWALIIAFIAGFCLLLPSLILLMRLFLFDAKYVQDKLILEQGKERAE